jgi:hypothetical protein
MMDAKIGMDGRSVRVPGHICLLTRGEADLRRRQAEFLRIAVESDREGIVLFGGAGVAETLYRVVQADLGADLSERRDSGMIALGAGDADADQQLENLMRPIEAMIARGATLVRIVGRPQWGGPAWPLPEDFVWFESRINSVIADLPVVIVCAYDVYALPGPGLILAGLQSHPTIFDGGLAEHNELFEPHVRNLQTRMVHFPWLTRVEAIPGAP